MTKTEDEQEVQTRWWHAFGRKMDGDLEGAYMLLIVGPTDKGPDEQDLQGTPIKEATVSDAPYVTSWDHEPTELEKDQAQPEEFRQLDDEGNQIEWEQE